MYNISDKTKMNIERVIGLPIEELTNMDIDEERSWIENKSKTKLSFSKEKNMELLDEEIPCLQGERYEQKKT